MANSDNVVRVGLTSKFKDYKALLDILKYEPGPVAILGGNPDNEIVIYETPAPEFRVSRFRLQAGAQRNVDTGHKPEVLIITQGKIAIHWDDSSATYHRGQSIFFPALLAEYGVTADQPAEFFRTQIPI
jgi:mannose-6-phosphate isomerase